MIFDFISFTVIQCVLLEMDWIESVWSEMTFCSHLIQFHLFIWKLYLIFWRRGLRTLQSQGPAWKTVHQTPKDGTRGSFWVDFAKGTFHRCFFWFSVCGDAANHLLQPCFFCWWTHWSSIGRKMFIKAKVRHWRWKCEVSFSRFKWKAVDCEAFLAFIGFLLHQKWIWFLSLMRDLHSESHRKRWSWKFKTNLNLFWFKLNFVDSFNLKKTKQKWNFISFFLTKKLELWLFCGIYVWKNSIECNSMLLTSEFWSVIKLNGFFVNWSNLILNVILFCNFHTIELEMKKKNVYVL